MPDLMRISIFSSIFTGNRLFNLFAFLSFAAAFSLRIGRDIALFTSLFAYGIWEQELGLKGGAAILGISFVINAFLMTWFAGKFESWIETTAPETISTFLLVLVAVAALLFGVSLDLVAGWGRLPWLALAIFVLSEIAIFLFMNMIWIFAGPRFTEVAQRSVFPKISGWGYIGILLPVLLGGMELVLLEIANASHLFYFSALLTLLAILLLPLIKSYPLISENDDEFSIAQSPDNDDESLSLGDNLAWAWRNRYLRLFILTTIMNFSLLAIFDQALASSASAMKINSKDLLFYLIGATGLFATIAAIVQFTGFRRWLDRFGAEKLNLGAPSSMIIGALISAVGLTGWLTGNLPPMERILWFAVTARVFGWIAEFLFNQSLLPYIYGALPSDVENRGRLVVEGPITAITNGAIGALLLLYVWIFDGKATSSDGSAVMMFDFMALLAIVFAIIMFIWSIYMIGEYKQVLLERLTSGEVISGLDKRSMQLINSLRRTAETIGRPTVPNKFQSKILSDLLKENLDDPGLSATFVTELHSLSTPTENELEEICIIATRLGVLERLGEPLTRWLENTTEENFVSIAQILVPSGFDGGIIIHESLLNRQASSGLKLSRAKLLECSALLGSEKWGKAAIDGFWEEKDYPDIISSITNPARLSALKFSEPALQFDLFLIGLARLSSERSAMIEACSKMATENIWLREFLLRLLFVPAEHVPSMFKTARLMSPLVLAKIHSQKTAGKIDYASKNATIVENREKARPTEKGRPNEIQKFITTISKLEDVDDFRGEGAYSILISNDKLAADPVLFANALSMLCDQQAKQQISAIDFNTGLDRWRSEAAKPQSNIGKKYLTRARIYLEGLKNHEAFRDLPDVPELAVQLYSGGSQADRIQARLEQLMSRIEATVLTQDIRELANRISTTA